MTRMIFVRHGESTGNLEKRYFGHTDGPLTELGREQAKRTAAYLKGEKIDAAYSSDLVRAYETGKIIAAEHGIEPVCDKGLREMFMGKWEGLLFEDLPKYYPAEYEIWMHNLWEAKTDGGESVQEMTVRVRDTVWKIAEKNDGKTVLVTFHGTPIRSLCCEWQGIPYERMNDVDWVPNASISIVNYDVKNHTIKPEIIGYIGFAEDISTALPKTV